MRTGLAMGHALYSEGGQTFYPTHGAITSGSNADTAADESVMFAALEMEDLLDLDALWDAQTSVAANRAAGLKVCPALVKHRLV